MKYEIINIPFDPLSKTFSPDDLNKFCLNKKIISSKVEFFQQDGNSFWSVFIEYEIILESLKNDTAGLTEAGKICFEELRRWRKETAEKEGLPAYIIAKNSQLIQIINKEISTLEALYNLLCGNR